MSNIHLFYAMKFPETTNQYCNTTFIGRTGPSAIHTVLHKITELFCPWQWEV